ncbi:hypothetical protein VW23_026510 [Devosia insulae DS-56]|uniref:Cytochrome c domain-containing protein n=1 Tax=Devosia insulae DS-56 TaxID=1116389 RepID=A0A1E5XKX7_9HYPH|nr:cytochrome c family protein [Devosia insulae]OEO29247.1 hypothetical protein VW23_026510 [Devosia insulae DS-56]
MDSFELNKIIGAVLGTLLFVMGVGFLAEAIYHPIEGRGPGLTLAEAEAPGEHGAGPAEPEAPAVPLGVLLASADATAGQASVRKCSSCHNFEAAGKNGTGPGLYGVVGRLIGSHEGFSYSAGMEEHKAKGDLWTYENLNAFITSPKTFTPGTKMSFAGVKDPAERANILAYLQTLSPSPVPFPTAEAAPAPVPAEGAAAPAEGVAPAEAGATEGAAVETPSTTATETSVEGTPAPATTEAPAASH